MSEKTYIDALRDAIFAEMERDVNVVLMGEDIGVYGGAFGVTRGLLDRFGPERVMDTPISEASVVGSAVGAAMTGLRPVVEIMFMDFIGLAADQLLNQASKLHYVFGEQARCPLVLRTPSGGRRCYGPTHSQCLEAMFMNMPGLKIVSPFDAADAAAMFSAAVRDDNPVLFIEHKMLYGRKSQVAEPDNAAPPAALGKARLRAEGDDLTIVSWSGMVSHAQTAVEQLAEYDVTADLVDLCTLKPLDTETILASAEKTGRVLVVEEGCRTGGIGGEVASVVFENMFDYLDGSVRRLGASDVPVPVAPSLENRALPSTADIVHAAISLVEES